MIKYVEPFIYVLAAGFCITFAAIALDFTLITYVNSSPGVHGKQLPCEKVTCKCGCEDKLPCRCLQDNDMK